MNPARFDCVGSGEVSRRSRKADDLVVVDIIKEIKVEDLTTGEDSVAKALWVVFVEVVLLLLVGLVVLLAHVEEEGTKVIILLLLLLSWSYFLTRRLQVAWSKTIPTVRVVLLLVDTRGETGKGVPGVLNPG